MSVRWLWTIAVLLLAACAPLRGPFPYAGDAMALSELAGEGDAERRTSMQLTLQGLDADAEGRPDLALAEYESAIRVDPGNPYAFLALARHQVSGTRPDRALDTLDKCQALLHAQGDADPRVTVHVVGLRGAALVASGRSVEGVALLDEARERAPDVWSDGHLSPRELR